MEKEKLQRKPDTSFNRRLSVAENLRGTWQRPNKILKNLFYREYGKEGIW